MCARVVLSSGFPMWDLLVQGPEFGFNTRGVILVKIEAVELDDNAINIFADPGQQLAIINEGIDCFRNTFNLDNHILQATPRLCRKLQLIPSGKFCIEALQKHLHNILMAPGASNMQCVEPGTWRNRKSQDIATSWVRVDDVSNIKWIHM